MLLSTHTTTLLLVPGLISGSLALPVLVQSPVEVQTSDISARVWCNVPGAACTGHRTIAIKRQANAADLSDLELSSFSTRADAGPSKAEFTFEHGSGATKNDSPESSSLSPKVLSLRGPLELLKLKISFCGMPGMGCNYRKSKRDFGELVEAPKPTEHLQPRSILGLLKISFCGMPGMGCAWKRAA
jgi:predicted small metal-binding protein